MRSLLIDETEATLEISAAEIRTIRKQDDRLAAVLPELVTAVVVPSDFGFGMARMWEILTERPGWSTRVFRSRPEAEAWLRGASSHWNCPRIWVRFSSGRRCGGSHPCAHNAQRMGYPPATRLPPYFGGGGA